MFRNTAHIVSSKVRSFFDNKAYGFERFYNEDVNESGQKTVKETTELSSLSNGTAGCVANGLGKPEGRRGSNMSEKPEFSHVEEGDDFDLLQRRNRITAWQAGWNVTNAIQVTFSFLLKL